jgi:uncharacterized membrane protein
MACNAKPMEVPRRKLLQMMLLACFSFKKGCLLLLIFQRFVTHDDDWLLHVLISAVLGVIVLSSKQEAV